MTETHKIYVFCAVPNHSPGELGTVQLEGKDRAVYAVPYHDMAFVVSHVDSEVLPTRDHLLAHTQLLSRVMQTQTVIPFSFGVVLEDEKHAQRLLASLHDHFQKIVDSIANKFEVGLKLFARAEWLESEVKRHSRLGELQKRVESQAEGGAFYEQIALGEAAQQFFHSLQRQFVQEVYEPLTRLADSAKLNEPTGERMLLNAAFLIHRDQELAFDQRVNQLYEKVSDRVEFHYSGPWPPYNFIDVRLKARGDR